MLGTDPALDVPIRSEDDLLTIFREAEKPKSEWRIGAEMEKPGVFAETLQPIPYEGEKGVLRVLEALVAHHGWHAERERDDGPIIALTRGGASVTLEPGGQLELSGAPLQDVHAICKEFRGHLDELKAISNTLGVVWLGIGFHPLAARADLPWVPKDRYSIMREYLPTRGAHAVDMMLRTSTVQANYDYADEADAMKKMRVALKLAPLTTALFANSPWLEGKPHGGVTYRGRVWLDVDPDRGGLVPALWSKDAGYKDYAAWALDVPMFLVKRGDVVHKNTGQTFRAFWKHGHQGETATLADWQLHLNTMFPEVRLKKTIEIRGADAQGTKLVCALPALWTGLLYDAAALDEADRLTESYDASEFAKLREDVWRKGLKATLGSATLQETATEVLAIAKGGLERRGRKRTDGRDERVHLGPLEELVARGETPAEALMARIEPTQPIAAQIVAAADLASP